MTLQDSLAALLAAHDYNGGSGSVEYCLCGWEGQSGHAHHVAEVQAVWLRDHFTEIAGELGLTRAAFIDATEPGLLDDLGIPRDRHERMVWCADCGHTPFRHDIKQGCYMCGCEHFRPEKTDE